MRPLADKALSESRVCLFPERVGQLTENRCALFLELLQRVSAFL